MTNRATTIGKGLLSLVAIVAVLIGIPVALWALGGNPLPDTIPSLQDAGDALLRPDDGSLFLNILTIAGWLGWASFAISILLEIPAHLRGIQAPRLPGLSLPQGSAAVWVAAVGAMLTLLTAGGIAHADTAQAAPPAATATTTHTTTATAPDQAPSTTPRAPTTAPRLHVVEKGDTLWDLAEDEFGDGTRYPEIADATKSTVQPGGQHLTDPDYIRPGWTVTIPTPATAASATPSTPTPAPAPAQPAPQTGHAPHVPDSAAGIPPAAADAARPPSSNSAGARPSTPAETPAQVPAQAAAPSETATANESDAIASPVTLAGLGALAAAGLLGALAWRRSRQSRRRAPGRRIALPTGPAAEAEAQLRAAADVDTSDLLDRALRTLSGRARDIDVPMPAIRAARITRDDLELYLVDPEVSLPAPFTTDPSDPGTWTLPLTRDDVLLTREDADEIPAPCPALVTIGHDETGAHLLLNLEELGALALTGDSTLCHETLTALAIELLTCSWTDDSRITLVNTLPELVDALGTDRANYVDTLDDVLAGLEYTARVHRQALTDAGQDSIIQARGAGLVDEAWTPHLILVTGTITPEQRERAATLLADIPRVALAAVTADTDPVGKWSLHIQPAGDGAIARLTPVPITLTPQRLPDSDYRATLALFTTADEPDVEGPAWANDISDGQPLSLVDVPDDPTVLVDAPDTATAEEDLAPAADDTTTSAEVADQATRRTFGPSPLAALIPGSDDVSRPLEEADDQTPEDESRLPDDAPAPVVDSEDLVDVDTSADATKDITADEDTDEDTDGDADEDPVDLADLEDAAVHPSPDVTVGRVAQILRLPSPEPLLRLLGPVELRHAQGRQPGSPRRALELLAYLALHPGRDERAFNSAIFPGERPGEKLTGKRNGYMRGARAWMGEKADGQPWVSLVNDAGGYSLSEDTAVDWWLFQRLMGDSIADTPTDSLKAALELVDGQPLSGIDNSRWAWAEADTIEILSAVADVAHELATRATSAGDSRTAAWAAAKGLEAEPVSEVLWRDAITAAWQSGIPGRTRLVIDRCHAATEHLGDLEDTTIHLINDVITSERRRRSS